MIEIENKASCCGCSACISACPVGCIDMAVDGEGFAYPNIDSAACVGCGRCEAVCPFINADGEAPVKAAFAVRTIDRDLLCASSSGGVFTELCKPVIEADGVVYGVAMSDDCRSCSFIRSESMDGVAPMRGSKYLQASSAGIYELVEEDLKAGRRVLFSGTPCQANALSLYLSERRDNLLIVDCICHGVPSPRLWRESVDDVEQRHGRTVRAVNFRCKEVSWKRFGLREELGGDALFQLLDESPYLRMFLRDVCLRESCYTCRAKETRAADITIADFWGIDKVLPEMADELGCSLVITRTQKGTDALTSISCEVIFHDVDYGDAILHNRAIHASALRPPERDLFFADLDAGGYGQVARKYGSITLKERGKRLTKSALAHVGLLDAVKKLHGGGSSLNSFRYGILYEFGECLSSGILDVIDESCRGRRANRESKGSG